MSGNNELPQGPGVAARRAAACAGAPRPPVRVLVDAATRICGGALADLLTAGAVDIMAVCAAGVHGTDPDDAVAARLQAASRVRVLTHPRCRLRARGWPAPAGLPPTGSPCPRSGVAG